MDMSSAARDAMLAAHIQYELERCTPSQLMPTVRQEISDLYSWLAQVQVRDVLPQDLLVAFLQRNVIARSLPDEVRSFLHENVLVALETIQDEQASLDTFVPKQIYDRMVENAAAMHRVRQRVIHQVVNSSIYSRLISNVLYHGLKSFLVSEHGVARTIPGATAFVRLGQNALNAAAPQLEKNVDKQLINFVADNIQVLVAESETFLDRTLDDAFIRKLGGEVWETTAGESLAEFSAAIDKQAVQALLETATDLALHLRTTELFGDILQAGVRGFYLRYGARSVADLLDLAGLSEEVAVREVTAMIGPLLQRARTAGFLEQRIRARLEPFYYAYFEPATQEGSAP